MEYKIIADGACDLYGENADKIGVQIVPFYVAFEENVYKKRVRKLKSATSIKNGRKSDGFPKDIHAVRTGLCRCFYTDC